MVPTHRTSIQNVETKPTRKIEFITTLPTCSQIPLPSLSVLNIGRKNKDGISTAVWQKHPNLESPQNVQQKATYSRIKDL